MDVQVSNTVSIVIAEDSPIQAKILISNLEGAGYSVRWGADGAKALELVRESPPDLIISDIEMPEMTGYEFCKAVKTDSDLRRIPLILLSTLSDTEDIIEGLQAGADNYVTKPYEPAYLLGRIESLLSTPLEETVEDAGPALKVHLKGKTYVVEAGRNQVLNLLLSTFENAVEKNSELISANQELTQSKRLLAKQNSELEHANTRMKRNLEAAARIQHSLLPGKGLRLDDLDVAWRYIPCDELAGDFLNFFPLDDEHVALYVVDVSGHGVASSLLSVAVARSLTSRVSKSSATARLDSDGNTVITAPADVASELNQRFQMDQQGDLYFTMFYGVLNRKTGKLRYVSAGHPAPVLFPSNAPAKQLPGDGFPIGVIEDIEVDEESITIEPGDRLFVVSDGVPEAMDKDLEQLGDDQMLDAIVETRGKSIDDAVKHLMTTVDHWCRINGPKDDVSILAVELGQQ
jgi:sigma-B regulation protein RsbU (phosphoserine phosphatase)